MLLFPTLLHQYPPFSLLNDLIVSAFKHFVDAPSLRYGSDTYTFGVMIIVVLSVSLVLSILVVMTPLHRHLSTSRLYMIVGRLAIYYVMLFLVLYGYDKVFKRQFRIPGPNILYSPLGYLDLDIAYWSVMGLSYGYVVFLGVVEVIAALLLVFQKGRLVGLLLALVTFVQVLAVNLFFGISVKYFSGFLLLLTLYGLMPYLSYLYNTLTLQPVAPPQLPALPLPNALKIGIKSFVILLMLLLPLRSYYPYYNDDLVPSRPVHGAYKIMDHPTMKRFFWHMDDYLILQGHHDKMASYKIRVDGDQVILQQGKKRLRASVDKSGDTLIISFDEQRYKGIKFDYQDLPALR